MTQKLSDILCLASDRKEETLLLHTVSVKSQQVAFLQNVGRLLSSSSRRFLTCLPCGSGCRISPLSGLGSGAGVTHDN